MSNSMRRVTRYLFMLTIIALGFASFAWLKYSQTQSEQTELTDNMPDSALSPLPEALQKLSDQCNADDIAACYQLATQLVIDEMVEVDLKRARPLFEKACLAGHSSACSDLGLTYESGQVNEDPDQEMADKWYTIACEAGDQAGCASLIRGNSEERESLEALIQRLQTSCDENDFPACIELALHYTIGQGVREDLSFAYNLYTKACDGKDMLGCYYLGSIYAEGASLEQDLKQAQHYYEMACDAGEDQACNNLASLLEERALANSDTTSATKDLTRARKLYEQACAAENYAACHNLAVIHQQGRGVTADLNAAHELFILACDNGEGAACHSLALLHANDEISTENDSVQAFTLYQKGCELGFPPACHNLGMMYATGQTEQAEPDFEAARNALASACEGLHFSACYFLSLLLQNGQGGPADPEAAQALMQIACDGGESNACDNL